MVLWGGLFWATVTAGAAGLEAESVGVRGATSATRINEHFYQVELFSRWNTPGQLSLGNKWAMRAAIDASAGFLARVREGDKGLIGTIGPVFLLGRDGLPLEMSVGGGGTILSRDNFNGVDFGIPFQFTSHLGFNWHFGERWTAGYRFQHMSNASLNPNNPGLDMHSFALSVRF
jgi:hypothetical protein